MNLNSKGFTVYAISQENSWKWQIILPSGCSLTSNYLYKTAKQATTAGKNWIAREAAFSAIDECLLEFCHFHKIDREEYRNLMDSLVSLTH